MMRMIVGNNLPTPFNVCQKHKNYYAEGFDKSNDTDNL
jgi:hypothetical protein